MVREKKHDRKTNITSGGASFKTQLGREGQL